MNRILLLKEGHFSQRQREIVAEAVADLPAVSLVVRYGNDRPFTREGGTIRWEDRASDVVVANAAEAVMAAGCLTAVMRADRVNVVTKKLVVSAMLTSIPAGTTVSAIRCACDRILSHPTFSSWLDLGLQKLTKCHKAYHMKDSMCIECPRRIEGAVLAVSDAVRALHPTMPRAWSTEDIRTVCSVSGFSKNATLAREVQRMLHKPPHRWVSCDQRAYATTLCHPGDDLCVWCPDWRRYQCVCSGRLPVHQVRPSVNIANDLAAIGGLLIRFRSFTCVINYFAPTQLFRHLRLWMQGRNGRSRFVRAVDIFGGLSEADGRAVEDMLHSHGQFGPLPPFPCWATTTLCQEDFPRGATVRLRERLRLIHGLR